MFPTLLTNELHEFSVPQNDIMPQTMEEAHNKFRHHAKVSAIIINKMGNWRDDTNPWMKWEMPKYEYKGYIFAGNWTTRFSKLYKVLYGESIDKDVLSQLGGFLGSFKKEMNLLFKIDRIFHWKPGDFGERDAASCWWEGKNHCRMGLAARESAYAVLFYKDKAQYERYEGKKGFGRSWLLHYPDKAFLFNAYGVSLSETANILANTFDIQQKKIMITSEGAYLNLGNYNNLERKGGSTGIAYVLAPDVSQYMENEEVEVENFSTTRASCSCCKKKFSPENLTLVGYEILCRQCKEEKYPKCDICRQNVTHVIKAWYGGGHVNVCDSCASSQNLNSPEHQCSKHGLTWETTVQAWHTNKRYCKTCRNEGLVIRCPSCRKQVNQYVKLWVSGTMLGESVCIPCSKLLIKSMKEKRYGDGIGL